MPTSHYEVVAPTAKPAPKHPAQVASTPGPTDAPSATTGENNYFEDNGRTDDDSETEDEANRPQSDNGDASDSETRYGCDYSSQTC